MKNPSTIFTCDIFHHEYDEANVTIEHGTDAILAQIKIASIGASITLSEGELEEVNLLIARFKEANAMMEGR